MAGGTTPPTSILDVGVDQEERPQHVTKVQSSSHPDLYKQVSILQGTRSGR